MREIRSYGSVRGVVGDRYPYRDSLFCFGFVVVRRRATRRGLGGKRSMPDSSIRVSEKTPGKWSLWVVLRGLGGF
jgi:hypothetical protein